MAASLLQSFSGSNTTTNTTLALTTQASAIPVGSVLVLSTCKAGATGDTTGIASITSTWGTWTKRANAVRSLSQDVEIWTMEVTTEIPASSTITITFNTSNNRKVGICSAWSGLVDAVPNVASNNSTQGLMETSVGDQGNNNEPAVAIVTTVAETLVVGATGFSGSTTTVVSDNSYTEIAEIVTSIGTTDRGVQQHYQVQSTSGTKNSNHTITGTAAWAASAIALVIESTGVTHNVNLTESIGVTDEGATQQLNVTQIITEAVGVTDTVIVELFPIIEIILTEAISVVDSVTPSNFVFTEIVGSVADALNEFLTLNGYTTGSLQDKQLAFLQDIAGQIANLESSADLQRYIYNKVRDFLRLDEI